MSLSDCETPMARRAVDTKNESSHNFLAGRDIAHG
jgi:hypothetical protein